MRLLYIVPMGKTTMPTITNTKTMSPFIITDINIVDQFDQVLPQLERLINDVHEYDDWDVRDGNRKKNKKKSQYWALLVKNCFIWMLRNSIRIKNQKRLNV